MNIAELMVGLNNAFLFDFDVCQQISRESLGENASFVIVMNHWPS
jgi:hypothetical protein